MFTFEGTEKKCSLKVYLRVHSPQFHWKVETQGDLGLADAFIHGDFSSVDKNNGLLNLFMIFVNNRDLKASVTRSSWWTPLLFTAAVSSTKYFIRHVSNQNTLTQACKNISRHYDLSNKLFSLFLDETMTYSCAIFKVRDPKLLKLSKNSAASVSDLSKLHYFSRIRHALIDILEESEQHRRALRYILCSLILILR
ncbi:hypothetical protein T459_29669 [Capsicum annuum]|uniref:Uncharacterized protein n=1 Tax=Capsicum annuum TaxID=4072 RepID=A0A2G2Y681_CAPAN|nr:hypothetical protein T459_29669 [Capsicum annuum]